MSGQRFQPSSQAAGRGFPDPHSPGISLVNCPYCIDAREQFGSMLPGCLAHFPGERAAAAGLTEPGEPE